MSSIKAIVCDQHGSLMKVAEKEKWLVQLCHFHLKARFYRYLGNRHLNIFLSKERVLIWKAVNEIVSVKEDDQVQELIMSLNKYSQIVGLPPRLKQQTQALAHNPWPFRTYLTYPEFNLPKTTSAIESMAGVVRDELRRRRGFNTVSSLKEWLRYIKIDHPQIRLIK